MGGANSIRGFLERQYSNDWGTYGNFEVYTPELISKVQLVDDMKMRVVGFYDVGRLYRIGPQAVEVKQSSASSHGVGLRITKGNSLSIRMDAAWTNKPANTGDPLQPTAARNFRLHGALVYLF